MRNRISTQRELSISLDSAAGILGITTDELQLFCKNDTECRYHHKTIYSNSIRFYPVNLKIIKRLIDKQAPAKQKHVNSALTG